MRELSFLAIILGALIGALLAAANAFVGLKAGMTISASIPAAVMSLLVLRKLLKRGSLLESNIVQTTGSAGESLAAGMIFTLPALFMMNAAPEYREMVIWGAIGGLLGVAFMVPLRRVLIVKEHGVLPFPEGVACAEVLQSGERGGGGAKAVIWGGIVGGVYHLIAGLGFFAEKAVYPISKLRTEARLDSSPALLGVGYILGARVAAYMLSGAILSWFILIPAIGFFGAESTQPVFPETENTISQMATSGVGSVYDRYVRYIGAGAVAIGGLISLFKSIPTILASFWHVVSGMFGAGRRKRERTDRDVPLILLVLVIAGLGYAMWELPQVRIGHIGAIAVLVFTFFFVTVSSRLVGIVGSSSNPISGMTIATVLATALVFKFFVLDKGGEGAEADPLTLRITCLSIGAIVCTAIAAAGDVSQDLKTGFLVKATPWKQQIAQLVGVITSVLAIAGVLILLDHSYGFVLSESQPRPLEAPQANIMKILVEGVLGGQVPWELILIGGAAAVVVELLGLPALPFAVGMYLPLELTTPIMVGGVVRWLVDRRRKEKAEHESGVLAASGLVAGHGLMGIALAGVMVLISWGWSNPTWNNPYDGDAETVTPHLLAPWVWSQFDGVEGGADGPATQEAADDAAGGPSSTSTSQEDPMEGGSIARWGLSERWWNLLPMGPFILLTIWLWWWARRKPTIDLPPSGGLKTGPTTPLTPDSPVTPPPRPGDPSSLSPIPLSPGARDDVVVEPTPGDPKAFSSGSGSSSPATSPPSWSSPAAPEKEGSTWTWQEPRPDESASSQPESDRGISPYNPKPGEGDQSDRDDPSRPPT